MSCSAIGEGGDTTTPSPGRSSKHPLPGIGLHDPLHGRQACPKIQLIPPGGWSNMSPVGAIFVPFPLKTGTKLLHPLPPPQSLNRSYKVLVCSTFLFFLIKSAYMKGHFVYGILRSSRNHFSSSRTPYIIYRNPTCKELSNNIAAREHPRAGSKHVSLQLSTC